MSETKIMKVVVDGLWDGYGIEDIAVRSNISISDIRWCVERLRYQGRLDRIVKAGKEIWSMERRHRRSEGVSV